MEARAVFLCAGGLLCAIGSLQAAGPVAVSPGSGDGVAHVATACPTFSWSAVEGATGYELLVLDLEGREVEVRPDADSPVGARAALSVSVRGPAIAWTPSVEDCLEAGGRYGWAVRALRGNGIGSWSEVQLFEVGLDRRTDLEVLIAEVLDRLLAARGWTPATTASSEAESSPQAGSASAAAVGRQTQDAGQSAGAFPAVSPVAEVALHSSMPAFPGIPDFGLHGVTHGSADHSAGVVGEAEASLGATRGVIGTVASGQGIGGLFENSGGGKILSATDGTFEKFAVTSTGVTADAAEIASATVTQALQLDGGRLLLDSGTAASPALSWNADTDTGVNADSNQVRISTGGTERLRLDGNALASLGPLQTGAVLGPAGYNRFGTASASQGGIQNIQDALVSDDLEVGDDLWVGGTLTAASLIAPHTHGGGDITGTVSNADTVDGMHASAFADDDHDHLGETWTTGGSGLTIQTSETSLGFALQGQASDTGTGSSRGVVGKASSTNGIGVFGWSTNLTHGIAIKGYSRGNVYPAAYFVNDNGGPLIYANSTDSLLTPKFAVQSDGDVEIAGVLTGSGAEASTISSSCGTFVALSFCPAGNTDGPPCNTVPAGAYCEYDAESGCSGLDGALDNCAAPPSNDWYLKTRDP